MADVTIRLLTYNVKMLPGLFGQGDDDLARADRIADKLLATEYDAIGLQEVFDEDVRRLFLERLGPSFPHRVEKSGDDWFNEDSGLMLFSRHPFCGTPTFAEWSSVGPLWNHDRWADKGVQVARLELGQGLTLALGNLHMQSDRDGPETYRPVRADQIAQLSRVLTRGLVRAREPAKLAALVLGDFNVIGDTDEHTFMLDTIRGSRDLFRHHHPEAAGYTIDGQNNTMVNDDEPLKRLDYMLAIDEIPGGGPDGQRVDLADVEVQSIAVEAFESDGASLSDHFAVQATLRLSD